MGYKRKFHNATGIRHLETLLHWTLSCLLASLFWCLVLTAPPWIHANLSVRLSLVQSQLPSAACLSALQPPTLLSPVQLPTASLLGRVVNSHSPPRTTSGYGEISCPRILCLVSRQNRQLNRLLWQPTPIVLHYVETFNSKVIKRFRTWTEKLLRVFEFWDSYVLSFLNEHYVYMLPTFHVHFAYGRIWIWFSEVCALVFTGLPFNKEIAPSWLHHINCVSPDWAIGFKGLSTYLGLFSI